jgi:pimeloyl-ACP methyl ester carboxylesterase
MSRRFHALVVGAALLTAMPLAAAPVAKGPDGLAFYDPPKALPRGAGTPVWTRPLAGTMALPSAAANTLLLYTSVDPKGRPAAVSATLAVPKGTPPKGGWPVIVWTHGTTGIARGCAPSLDDANGPEHGYISVIATLLDGFVKDGYAIVASDYQGLGTPGPHPFLQGVPNAANALHALRAARQIETSLGRRYAVVGHSQGGHADLFAAARGPIDIPEFRLLGDVAFAPGSQIKSRLDLVMTSSRVELSLPYVLYVLQSYSQTDPRIRLDRILTKEAVSHLPDLMQGCMTAALTRGYWSTAIARDQFLAKPDLAAFLRMAARNEPGTLRIPAPTLVVQGTADTTVFPSATDLLTQQLCARGNVVRYDPVPGADHDGSMSKGGDAGRAFVAARFKGEFAASQCRALPRAVPKS